MPNNTETHFQMCYMYFQPNMFPKGPANNISILLEEKQRVNSGDSEIDLSIFDEMMTEIPMLL